MNEIVKMFLIIIIEFGSFLWGYCLFDYTKLELQMKEDLKRKEEIIKIFNQFRTKEELK